MIASFVDHQQPEAEELTEVPAVPSPADRAVIQALKILMCLGMVVRNRRSVVVQIDEVVAPNASSRWPAEGVGRRYPGKQLVSRLTRKVLIRTLWFGFIFVDGVVVGVHWVV